MNSIREFGLNIYLFVSKGLESCFEAFFPFPRGWKVFFFSFSFIQGVGRPFFPIFCSSKGSESHFFQFSAHPRGWKTSFSSFLLSRGLGKPFFPVFCSSKGLESHFFQFFVHPSSRKAIFFNFLLSRDLGKPFFSVFCSSEASDGHFFTPIAPSKPKQVLKPNSHNSIGNTYGQGCCVHFCFSALLRIYKRLLEVSS